MHEAFWNGLSGVRWEEAPLGPEAIRLVRRLRERGYAGRTCRDYGHAVVHLGRYLHEELESDRGSKTSEPPKVMLSSMQSAILLTPADHDSRHHDKEGHRARSHNSQLHITGILSCQAKHQLAGGADGARRPGRLGRDLAAWRRARTSRCQRSTVSGRTSRRNRPSTSLGSRCSRAARNARSPGQNRGRVLPSCRSRTVIWWRSARISMSLSRSLIGSSRSNANAFVTLR
jgi:hypothetical protein